MNADQKAVTDTLIFKVTPIEFAFVAAGSLVWQRIISEAPTYP